jgi:hypothetical protein
MFSPCTTRDLPHTPSQTGFEGTDIGKWNVAKVTILTYFAYYAHVFNGDIGRWNVAKVTSIKGALWNAYMFSRDLDKWDVSSVTSAEKVFWHGYDFVAIHAPEPNPDPFRAL